jgi:uncharacterized protein (DUF1778 family)
MSNENQYKNIEIRLPEDLYETLRQLADLEGETLNSMIVTLLDQAVFITPQDLAMIKDKALRKAELDQLAEDEGIMVDKYKGIINEINKAADFREKLK